MYPDKDPKTGAQQPPEVNAHNEKDSTIICNDTCNVSHCDTPTETAASQLEQINDVDAVPIVIPAERNRRLSLLTEQRANHPKKDIEMESAEPFDPTDVDLIPKKQRKSSIADQLKSFIKKSHTETKYQTNPISAETVEADASVPTVVLQEKPKTRRRSATTGDIMTGLPKPTMESKIAESPAGSIRQEYLIVATNPVLQFDEKVTEQLQTLEIQSPIIDTTGIATKVKNSPTYTRKAFNETSIPLDHPTRPLQRRNHSAQNILAPKPLHTDQLTLSEFLDPIRSPFMMDSISDDLKSPTAVSPSDRPKNRRRSSLLSKFRTVLAKKEEKSFTTVTLQVKEPIIPKSILKTETDQFIVNHNILMPTNVNRKGRRRAKTNEKVVQVEDDWSPSKVSFCDAPAVDIIAELGAKKDPEIVTRLRAFFT